MKKCCRCKINKNITEFSRNSSCRDGLHPECKICNKLYRITNRDKILLKEKEYRKTHKEKIRIYSKTYYENNKEKLHKPYDIKRQLKHRHGLTITERDAILELQGRKCGICHEPILKFAKNTHIDHCHLTGKIRGILCSNCNRGIGYLKDSTEILQSAIEYLEKHNV